MALTHEQSAAQLILDAADNLDCRLVLAPQRGGDPEVWDLVMRGVNSPKMAGRHVEIAQRVRDRLVKMGVRLPSDSLARWFAPELCGPAQMAQG